MKRKGRTSLNKLKSKLMKIKAPLHAVWFAEELYEGSIEMDYEEKDIEFLWIEWRKLLETNGWHDLLDKQVNYATHLAKYGEFIYEDMHKLIATLHGIEVIRLQGLELDKEKENLLYETIVMRFKKDPSLAHLAKDRFRREWNKDWWYYTL